MYNSPKQHIKALRLTKQATGTLAKVAQMIELDQYCPSIIHQIDVAIGLLKACIKIGTNYACSPSRNVDSSLLRRLSGKVYFHLIADMN